MGCPPGLPESRSDTRQHLPTNHADFVDDDQLCAFEGLLKTVQPVGVLKRSPLPRVEPVNQAMQRGGPELELKGSGAGGRGDADKVEGNASCKEQPPELLQRGPHRGGLPGTGSAQQQQTQGGR